MESIAICALILTSIASSLAVVLRDQKQRRPAPRDSIFPVHVVGTLLSRQVHGRLASAFEQRRVAHRCIRGRRPSPPTSPVEDEPCRPCQAAIRRSRAGGGAASTVTPSAWRSATLASRPRGATGARTSASETPMARCRAGTRSAGQHRPVNHQHDYAQGKDHPGHAERARI